MSETFDMFGNVFKMIDKNRKQYRFDNKKYYSDEKKVIATMRREKDVQKGFSQREVAFFYKKRGVLEL